MMLTGRALNVRPWVADAGGAVDALGDADDAHVLHCIEYDALGG